MGIQASEKKEERCEFDTKSYQKNKNITTELQKICPACQMFGCTGWSRKFSLKILDEEGNLTRQIKPHKEYTIKILEVKNFREQEIWLISKTVWIICEYGAIGGKTVLKPQSNPSRQISGPYGIIELIEPLMSPPRIDKDTIRTFLKSSKKKSMPLEWPDLRYFFFKKGETLDRITLNSLRSANIFSDHRKEEFFWGKAPTRTEKAVSKKIFSFKEDGKTLETKRFWGYVLREDKANGMLPLLLKKMEEFVKITNIKTGKQVIENEL
ncbi:MAG: hypothetical protein AB1638_09625 [Nitrospirota bacterium]